MDPTGFIPQMTPLDEANIGLKGAQGLLAGAQARDSRPRASTWGDFVPEGFQFTPGQAAIAGGGVQRPATGAPRNAAGLTTNEEAIRIQAILTDSEAQPILDYRGMPTDQYTEPSINLDAGVRAALQQQLIDLVLSGGAPPQVAPPRNSPAKNRAMRIGAGLPAERVDID